tara:strand:- start:4278 stop:5918 length:1641 start_codon:yes stop_codon:yes gene_type:complete
MDDIFNNNKQTAIQVIESLYDKYKDNEYMYDKLNHYMQNQLTSTIDNMCNNHETKLIRLKETAEQQHMFTENFLTRNQYFYLPSTEYFVYYDGGHYQLISEDDIQYNILRTITRNDSLVNQKRQIKTNIIKKIKDNILYKTIPESDTIQSVIEMLYPSLFASKTEAKYFLTVLGDNILKKEPTVVHFITIKSKFFLKGLTQISHMLTGRDMCTSIKHKYHNHSYQDSRLIKINECINNENIVNSVISNNILNLICVSIHYSKRFDSSDSYLLNHSNDDSLNQYAFFIKNTNHDELMDLFIHQYIDFDENLQNTNVLILDDYHTNRSKQITWKNMLFIWKKFIDHKQIPFIITSQNMKSILIEKLSKYYQEDRDSFIGICSKFIPSIENFLNFWNDTMIDDETEVDLEIDEIVILFKTWCNIKHEIISNLNDKQMLDLILHYFPSIEIERDKFIANVRCNIWDKQMDIQLALDHIKETLNQKIQGAGDSNDYQFSIYDIYLSYCKYVSENNIHKKLIVNKSYFDKYIIENFQEYIVDSKFLNSKWCA